MDEFKLQSVNWQDGMLLTMGHLRAQEGYFEELVRWHAFGANDIYGLAKKDSAQPPLKIDATMSGNRLRVEVKRCQAVLPCGAAVPAPRINDVVRGRRGVSTDTAMRLARYFGGDARSWLNLQAAYDLRVAEIANGKRIAREISPAAA